MADGPAEDQSALERIRDGRLAKVEAMRAAGDEPYPYRFERTAVAADLHARFDDLPAGTDTGEMVIVAGRLMNVRHIGGLSFGVLQDWSGQIQLFVTEELLGQRYAAFGDLDAGDWVGATGEVVTTKRGELSVRVAEFVLLAKGLLPLPEKWHGLVDVEKRHRQRYLDLIVNDEARRVMAARIDVVASLRSTLAERGFVEVETPLLHEIAAGALARPFITHHDALGIDMYLRIAIELHLKRLVVGGVERVFEIGRVFRNEGVSVRHNPEFTMLEAYQALADYGDMADLTEALVADAAMSVCGTTELTYQGKPLDLTPPWKRIRYFDSVAEATGEAWDPAMSLEEARALAKKAGVHFEQPWGVGKIVAEMFEALVEPTLWDPTFVMDFPKEISPLAKDHRQTAGLVERFEVICTGTELANAFSELNDPIEQRQRFEAQVEARKAGDDEAHPMDEDFIRALEYGLPPTGGLGVGVDRLVMLLTDQSSIREVLLFPALRPE